MSKPSRRTFVLTLIAGGGSALIASRASAQSAAPKLEVSDPQAVALGYNPDASAVDKAKYPQHTADQMCGVCNFFQGKAGDALAPCQLFGGKQVSSKGWCAAFAKKPA